MGRALQKEAIKPHPPTPSRFSQLLTAPPPHLEEGVSLCAAELEQGIERDANDRGQSQKEADGHSPAWILVVVVGDGLVLDHREDENELQRGGMGVHMRPAQYFPRPPFPRAWSSSQYPFLSSPVAQTRKRHFWEGRGQCQVLGSRRSGWSQGSGHGGQVSIVEEERSIFTIILNQPGNNRCSLSSQSVLLKDSQRSLLPTEVRPNPWP